MYLATLSDLANDPVFIWFEHVATAKSEMKVSSVSPERWEIIVFNWFSWANSIVSNVSLTVPIWFNLIKIAFADFSLIPFFSLFLFVTKRSSPTIWTLLPIKSVKLDHEFQSSSKKGSSIDFTAYFLIKFK